MKYWKKLTPKEQDERITNALKNNIDYSSRKCLGVPASKLDPAVFYEQASFLKDAPLLRTYVQNPNHIGCHTFGVSESFFKGTQQLEQDVIELLSVDLFKAQPQSCDGYVASGGTEANIQAAWIYRNYFIREHGATNNEIALLCSTDTHYSIAKASNLLGVSLYNVPVDDLTRTMQEAELEAAVQQATEAGVKCFIVFSNMGTTMFGSVDDPNLFVRVLDRFAVKYKLHVDGAFGGFIYPVTHLENNINFNNPVVSSITLDAHKMLQAPYGTGVFLVRKGMMQYAYTEEAKYVSGMDMTLSGSRGGANAVAIWMILFTYGPYGWLEKINKLIYRTNWLSEKLSMSSIVFYRHPDMNIITIKAEHVSADLAAKYMLVPDNHDKPEWYKIVVMDHVSIDDLLQFYREMAVRKLL
jgi:tyrosine decarboxylase/aspartate 1-decarboxylase